MAVTLIHTDRRPSSTQFGLDSFTEIFKANDAADAVAVDPSVPQRGDAHPDYPFMFVTDRHFNESGPQACACDIVYMGCMKDDGEGNPELPPAQSNDEDQVMSASSKMNSLGGILDNPLTVQYYAPTSVYSWITYGAKGSKGTASDPDRSIEVITVVLGDVTFSYGTVGMADLINLFFTRQISDTIQSQEVVAGKFWLNTERKILNLMPYIFTFTAGFYPVLYDHGRGYTVGDSITITGTGSCTMDVTWVGAGGEINGVSITDNSLSGASPNPISATGGTGTGARFTVIQVG